MRKVEGGTALGGSPSEGQDIDQRVLFHSPPRGLRSRVLAWLGTWLLRLQYATWRTDVEGLARLDRIFAEGERVP